MAEADLDQGPINPHVPTPAPTRRRPLWVHGIACVAILPLLGFIGQSGHQLWGDFNALRQDHESVRTSEVVGYIDINPCPTFARSPDGWIHTEGGTTQLWAGWQKGKHHWFEFGTDDFDPRQFTMPMGQDSIRAIDVPLLETRDGEHWVRVPAEARVASFGSGSSVVAYPWTILDKVEVVNDQFDGRPVLIAFMPVEEKTSMYETTLDGKPITFGLAGYFLGYQPVLYDRGTESLWTQRDQAMVAIAGTRKGASLKLISRVELVSWSDWKAEHPDGKLLIGADRSKPKPSN